MLRDLRHAVRVLLKAKGWSAVVLLSLALGIGANTALFSAVNGLLFKTIPVTDPHALVRLRWAGPNDMLRDVLAYGFTADTAGGERASASFSYPMFERLRDGNDTLEGLVAAAPTRPSERCRGLAPQLPGHRIRDHRDLMALIEVAPIEIATGHERNVQCLEQTGGYEEEPPDWRYLRLGVGSVLGEQPVVGIESLQRRRAGECRSVNPWHGGNTLADRLQESGHRLPRRGLALPH